MKLIGPTLLKQDTEEVKVNVNKRIEYIEAEMYVNYNLIIHLQSIVYNFVDSLELALRRRWKKISRRLKNSVKLCVLAKNRMFSKDIFVFLSCLLTFAR